MAWGSAPSRTKPMLLGFDRKQFYIARSTVIPILEEDSISTDMKEQMERFTPSLHDVIGDHHHAIIWGEVINEEDIYHDAFFDNGEELEGITYPWDKDLEDVPLMDQNNNTMKDLDEYIGTHVVMPGRDGT